MYLIVAVIAAGAGIAIAGFPDSTGADATIIPPASTVAVTVIATTTTTPSTTVASSTTTAPADTDPPSTDPPTTNRPKRTRPRKTDPPVETLPPLAAAEGIAVVVANGAAVGGAAGRTTAQLIALGYTDASATDGVVIVDSTIIYFADPFFLEAVRMTGELGLPAESVASIAEAPPVLGGIEGVDLLAYLGRDQA